MNIFQKVLLPIVAVALLYGCNREEIKIIGPFPVDKSIEYTTGDIVGLIDPVDLVVNSKFLFLKAWKADTLIQQYSLPDLEFVKGFGRKGRGPGEFQSSPYLYMSPYSEKFYIRDNWMLQSYRTEDNGDLVPVEQTEIRKGNGLYNQYHVINDSLLVYFYDVGIDKINLLTNEVTGSIDLNVESGSDGSFHPNFGTMAANNENIAYVYRYRKQIDIYNLDDMSLKVRLRGKGYRNNNEPTPESDVFYLNAYATDRYLYAYALELGSRDEDYKYFIEVFDWDGNPVKKLGLPIGGIFAVTPDDSTIYSFSWKQEDKILRYEVR